MLISRRAATVSDREFARLVHHRAYRDVIQRQYGSWDEPTQDAFFEVAWLAAAHEIILCDAVRCGYLGVQDRGDDLYLRELVIDPSFQGRGIGTQILRTVMEQAAVKNLPLRLQTHLVNRAANLYRRMGFQESGRTDVHILFEWNEAV